MAWNPNKPLVQDANQPVNPNQVAQQTYTPPPIQPVQSGNMAGQTVNANGSPYVMQGASSGGAATTPALGNVLGGAKQGAVSNSYDQSKPVLPDQSQSGLDQSTGQAQPANTASQQPGWMKSDGSVDQTYIPKSEAEAMNPALDTYSRKILLANYYKAQGMNIDPSQLPANWNAEAKKYMDMAMQSSTAAEQKINFAKAQAAGQNQANDAAVTSQLSAGREGVQSQGNDMTKHEAIMNLDAQYNTNVADLNNQLNQIQYRLSGQGGQMVAGREDQLRAQQQAALTQLNKLMENKHQAMMDMDTRANTSQKMLKDLNDSGALAGMSPGDVKFLQDGMPGMPPGVVAMVAKAADRKLATTNQQTQFDDSQKALGTMNTLATNGVSLTPEMMMGFQKQTGLPLESIMGFNTLAQQIMQNKSLTNDEKQAQVGKLNEELSLQRQGIYTDAGKNIATLESMYKQGADPHTIALFKQAANLKDTDDPMYSADLQIKQATAQQDQIKAQYAGKEPPYGTKDYWDVQKLKAEVGAQQATMGDLTQGALPTGSIAMKYEAGGDPGRISSGKGDAGGVSYGQFQLSRGNIQGFIQNSPYADQFKGLTPGTADFNNKWKEVAANDPSFGDAQKDYITQTHYQPQLQKVQQQIGNIANINPAIKEMIMSTAIQYGPNTNVIVDALAGKPIKNMSAADIINTVQDYKKNTLNDYFGSSSQGVRNGVSNRITNEKTDLLNMAGTTPDTAQQLGGALPPNLESLAQKVASYDLDPKLLSSRLPKGASESERAAILSRATEIDPNFDTAQFPARADLKKNLTSGDLSTNIRSINTLVGHLTSLHDNIDKLGNGPIPALNASGQAMAGALGSSVTTKFNQDKQAVADELAKVFKGGGTLTEGEAKQWEKSFDSASSPEQLKAATDNAIELMTSRLSAIRGQYKQVMGHEMPNSILTDSSRKALAGLGHDVDSIEPPATTPDKQSTAPSWQDQIKGWLGGGQSNQTQTPVNAVDSYGDYHIPAPTANVDTSKHVNPNAL